MVSSSILHGEDGSEIGAVRYKKDLRERKRWEKELGDAQEEVQEAQGVAEQAQASAIAAEKLAALGRLTAGVSHEVLNPISTITMRLNMMLDDPETPSELASHLRTIDDQANRIVKITENLLHFGRHRPPERRQIDLNDIVKRILDLLEPDLMKLNITVVLGLSAALPPVWADPDQVQQVRVGPDWGQVFGEMALHRDALGLQIVFHKLEGLSDRLVDINLAALWRAPTGKLHEFLAYLANPVRLLFQVMEAAYVLLTNIGIGRKSLDSHDDDANGG